MFLGVIVLCSTSYLTDFRLFLGYLFLYVKTSNFQWMIRLVKFFLPTVFYLPRQNECSIIRARMQNDLRRRHANQFLISHSIDKNKPRLLSWRIWIRALHILGRILLLIFTSLPRERNVHCFSVSTRIVIQNIFLPS